MITLPSQDELTARSAAFDQDWGAVDDVLYRICEEYPGHSDRRALTAKVALIDRAYSAGLERRVTPSPGQQAISVIADYFFAHHSRVDAILGELDSVTEPLSMEAVAEIVKVHGHFVAFLLGVTTDGKSPRSFAAKYLHFHNPAVPIYDGYAAAGLVRLVRWDSGEIPFACPAGGDSDYYDFCVRFWRLYEACRDAGLKVSVKSLDHYLWSAPAGGAQPDTMPT